MFGSLKRHTDFVYDKGERLGLFGAGIENVSVAAKLETLAAEPCAFSNITYFEVAEHLADTFDISPTIGGDDRIVLGLPREIQLAVRVSIVDLRPALKAGVSESELREQLAAIVEKSVSYARDAAVLGAGPGCSIVSVDFWTALRIETFIRETAKAGKISDLPPLPNFLTRAFQPPARDPVMVPAEPARHITDE